MYRAIVEMYRENTCECGECREDREIDEADLISGTEYEQNEGCRFSACGCNETAEKFKACCRWLWRVRSKASQGMR